MKELCLKYEIVVCPKREPTRQMVLGTDNQEEEPPHEGSLPMPMKRLEPPTAPELSGASSLYPNMPLYPGAPPHKSQLEYVP